VDYNGYFFVSFTVTDGGFSWDNFKRGRQSFDR